MLYCLWGDKMLFVHENNLKNKINGNYNGKGKEINDFYNNIYLDYKNNLLSIDYSKENIDDFSKATGLMDEYLGKIDNFSDENKITSQSKFRSTFIEELSSYLFNNLPLIKDGTFGVYNKNIFAGMKINNHMHIDIIPKDVDFCIGKKVNLLIDEEQKLQAIIPIVCVEVKTYLDSTMFGEVQYSSMQIKNASPNARTYVLMEYNEVADEKIISARYDNNLNEMFVLRGGKRSKSFLSPLSGKVLLDYYKEIVKALNETSKTDKVIVPGLLINPKKDSTE